LFGIPVSATWAVTLVRVKGGTFFLSESDGQATKIVWTRKRDKARRFTTNSDAVKFSELVKSTRSDKKTTIGVVQI
jgi:hypothetical protein